MFVGKSKFPEIDVIAGNIATGEAAIALRDAGADAVKIELVQVRSAQHVLLQV